MLDLSPMKGIRVDPAARTVRAEAGVLWGELDRETHAFGLATPGGAVSTTGIAGLTLGGGQSWLTGKHGFAIDNLLSVDIVTADGELRHASATENADLFWAVRGAGHNFGVVTSFEYRLHPVTTVLGGMVIHPFERARDVLRFYREFTASAPDELTSYGRHPDRAGRQPGRRDRRLLLGTTGRGRARPGAAAALRPARGRHDRADPVPGACRRCWTGRSRTAG